MEQSKEVGAVSGVLATAITAALAKADVPQVEVGKVASVAEQRSDKPLPVVKRERKTYTKAPATASVKSALHPDRLMPAANEAADKSYDSIGRKMAKAYLAAIGEGSKSWQEFVVTLMRTANDAQQERAMKAATEVAESEDDTTARDSLKKRISEARRVFKAVRADFDGVTSIFAKSGSWHSKVAQMPKSNRGRPASTPGGVTDQSPDKGETGTAAGHAKVKAIPVGEVLQQLERLSYADLLKCLDLIAYRLASAPKKSHALLQSLGTQVMKVRDIQDKAQITAETASISAVAG